MDLKCGLCLMRVSNFDRATNKTITIEGRICHLSCAAEYTPSEAIAKVRSTCSSEPGN